jgi:hypothetical protein
LSRLQELLLLLAAPCQPWPCLKTAAAAADDDGDGRQLAHQQALLSLLQGRQREPAHLHAHHACLLSPQLLLLLLLLTLVVGCHLLLP